MQTWNVCLLLSALVISAHVARAQTDSKPAPTVETQTASADLALPKTGMVFAAPLKDKGQGLIQLHATEIVSNSHAAGNFARSAVYVGARASTELKGLNASVHVDDARASFYVRINSEDPDLMRRRVHLIRMEQTKDRRVVSNYSQNIFGGQRAKKYDDIAITKADVEPDVWLKVTPDAPLAPGEYGIVFMPKDLWLTPDAVYDFNVAFDTAKPETK